MIETVFFFHLPGGRRGGGWGRTGGRPGAKENRQREECIRREMKEWEMVVLIKEREAGSLVDIAYLYLIFAIEQRA